MGENIFFFALDFWSAAAFSVESVYYVVVLTVFAVVFNHGMVIFNEYLLGEMSDKSD